MGTANLLMLDGEEWCIANSTCPDPVLQHGLNWACANGADCDKTLPGQPCFLPNSLKDHASYAYKSYYKKFKTQGATCNFAYSGILTNVDPSKIYKPTSFIGICIFNIRFNQIILSFILLPFNFVMEKKM